MLLQVAGLHIKVRISNTELNKSTYQSTQIR